MFNGYNMDELAQSVKLIKRCLAEDVPDAQTPANESPAIEKPVEAA
jgi:hypothetical protein